MLVAAGINHMVGKSTPLYGEHAAGTDMSFGENTGKERSIKAKGYKYIQGNSGSRDQIDHKPDRKELAIDILNAALKPIIHKYALPKDCEYLIFQQWDVELRDKNGRRIHFPDNLKNGGLKAELVQKINELEEINSLLDKVEKHEAAIGNCIKDIKNVIGDNRKKSPQALVSGIKEIAEKYANEQKITP
ncbi:hypothetical protein H1Q59_07855 [Holosporaceae bacterium 'Namur']|nr:hypothetical protein [Holosporaceae bacterium 'Namur']